MSDYLKERIARLITKRVMAWLISRAAFFAVGPVKVIVGFFIEKLMSKAIELTFLGGMIAYIFLDTRSDLNAVEKIIKEINQKTDELSEEEMDEYDKRLAKAGRDLIQYGTIS